MRWWHDIYNFINLILWNLHGLLIGLLYNGWSTDMFILLFLFKIQRFELDRFTSIFEVVPCSYPIQTYYIAYIGISYIPLYRDVCIRWIPVNSIYRVRLHHSVSGINKKKHWGIHWLLENSALWNLFIHIVIGTDQ